MTDTTAEPAPEMTQPRRIDGDCTWTYTVHRETWFADSFKDDPPTISVHASADGGGVKWEVQVSEHDLGGRCTQLKMFSDAYAALGDVPEFFEALRDDRPQSLAEVRTILHRLGARDETERVSPHVAITEKRVYFPGEVVPRHTDVQAEGGTVMRWPDDHLVADYWGPMVTRPFPVGKEAWRAVVASAAQRRDQAGAR